MASVREVGDNEQSEQSNDAIDKSGAGTPGNYGNLVFAIRVKLPVREDFPDDYEFEQARNRAIFAEKPRGFEVLWHSYVKYEWMIDSEGFTWVPLFLSSSKDALLNALNRAFEQQRYHQRLKDEIRKLSGWL